MPVPQSHPPFRADHVGSLLRPPRLLAARDEFAAGIIDAAAAAGRRGRGDRRGRGRCRRSIGPAVGDRRRVPPRVLAHGLHLPARRHQQGAGQPGGEVPEPVGHDRVHPRRAARRRPDPDRADDLRARLPLPAVGGHHGHAQADHPVAQHGALPRRPGRAGPGGLPGHRGVLDRTCRPPTPTEVGPAGRAGLPLPPARRHQPGLPQRPGAARRDRRARRGRRAPASPLHPAGQRRDRRAARRAWP